MPAIPLGLVVVTLLGLSLISGFRPLYILLYVVLVGTGLGYLWSWLQSRGLEVEVESLSSHPQVGQTTLLRVTVRERIGVPRLGLRVALSERSFGEVGHVLDLPPKGSSTWTARMENHRRGINLIGTTTIATSDPFGVVQMERAEGEARSVMVYPRMVPLSPGISIGQAVFGEMAQVGQMTRPSTSTSRVRPYLPGDSLNRIHWPTTARLDRLMTKEFDTGGHSEIWLCLDLQATTQAGSGLDSTAEYGITIAASLAKALLDAGQSVGLVTQGDGLHHLPPDRDPNHLWQLLTALALVQAEGAISMSDLMAREMSNLGPDATAVVIAPWPGQDLGALFQFLSRRGMSWMPILLDAGSFDGRSDSRLGLDPRFEQTKHARLIRRGDDLSSSLSGMMDRLVY